MVLEVTDLALVEALSVVESTGLSACEVVIERGLSTFIEVGQALKAIRDGRLYREIAPTFDGYLEQRWPDLGGRRYANRVIAASETVGLLGPIGPILPATETQARPLTQLPTDQQIVAWQRVIERSVTHKAQITAALVGQVIKEMQAEAEAVELDAIEGEVIEVEAINTEAPKPGPSEPEAPEPDPVEPLILAPLSADLPALFTVGDWRALGQSIRRRIIAECPIGSGAGFNRTNDQVEWALWTWNPVTGCDHGCNYCYARDIAERFYTEVGPAGARFAPVFRPSRLHAPRRMKVPKAAAKNVGERNVFVCSMADLFGKWVPQEWIDAVFAEVVGSPDWNFLFLTKFPQRLASQDWPENAWCGTTVDTQARIATAERSFRGVKAGVKWLSCEPLLERLTFKSLEMFDWVVIGGQSKASQVPEFQPEWEWVEHLIQQARDAGCKVYLKPNLTCRPREYPAGAVIR